jgi:hypothetical protein
VVNGCHGDIGAFTDLCREWESTSGWTCEGFRPGYYPGKFSFDWPIYRRI